MPFAWMAWLIRGRDRVVLVDTGFADEALAARWKIQGYRPLPEGLALLQVRSEDVTDVVITHAHWDHLGNVGPYRNAEVWIQQPELDWARSRVTPEKPERSGVRLQDLQALDGLKLHAVTGKATVTEGITVHPGGGHTPGVQWVQIDDGARTVVLTSDIAYLYENLERQVPPGGSRDPDLDATQILRMQKAARPAHLVVPGHDPLVFERFPTVAPGIVEIR